MKAARGKFSAETVKAYSTRELATIYNSYTTGKSVARFATRADAERRAIKAFTDAQEAKKFIEERITHVVVSDNVIPDQTLINDESGDAPVKKGNSASNRSAGIAKSWENIATKVKRSERSGVKVDGVYYGSVPKAFRELHIQDKGVIKFRMRLKKALKLTEYGRSWEIVALNYVPDSK